MTMLDWFRLVGRRWYIYVACIMVAIAAVIALGSMPRIYTATAELQFNEPKHLPGALKGEDQRETLIGYTGAVISRYDAEYPNVTLSSPTATLFGNGLREGVAVELAAMGNQWTMSFVRPVVIIHAASARAEDVLPMIRRVAGDVESTSRGLQREAGTAETYQITTTMDLDLVTVSSFGQTRTGRVGGTTVLVGAALILSTLVARLLEHFKQCRSPLELGQEPVTYAGHTFTRPTLTRG